MQQNNGSDVCQGYTSKANVRGPGSVGWFGSVGLVGCGWLCEVLMTSLDFLKIDG